MVATSFQLTTSDQGRGSEPAKVRPRGPFQTRVRRDEEAKSNFKVATQLASSSSPLGTQVDFCSVLLLTCSSRSLAFEIWPSKALGLPQSFQSLEVFWLHAVFQWSGSGARPPNTKHTARPRLTHLMETNELVRVRLPSQKQRNQNGSTWARSRACNRQDHAAHQDAQRFI